MTIDIRAQLLRKRLAELQEDHAFWCGWAAAEQLRRGRPCNPTHTLASLQQQIDELEAQLKAVEAGQ
jgi:hypothetical protein